MTVRRVLILGGTAEAAELADRLYADPSFEPITSLAGRTRNPALPSGTVRVGGFGGADGLARYLAEYAIDLLVDATHPFAEQISYNAADAGRAAGVPRLRLERPPWRRQPGDLWIKVDSAADAARRLPVHARRVFLSIGRQHIGPFAERPDVWFLLRLIEASTNPLPLTHCHCIIGRGPFSVKDETALLERHGIDAIVSKNSGGNATYAKIAAARELGRPVVMIARRRPPAGEIVENVRAALAWLAAT